MAIELGFILELTLWHMPRCCRTSRWKDTCKYLCGVLGGIGCSSQNEFCVRLRNEDWSWERQAFSLGETVESKLVGKVTEGCEVEKFAGWKKGSRSVISEPGCGKTTWDSGGDGSSYNMEELLGGARKFQGVFKKEDIKVAVCQNWAAFCFKGHYHDQGSCSSCAFRRVWMPVVRGGRSAVFFIVGEWGRTRNV